jgi:hypothetical protein
LGVLRCFFLEKNRHPLHLIIIAHRPVNLTAATRKSGMQRSLSCRQSWM